MDYSGQHHWVKYPHYHSQQPVTVPLSPSYSSSYLSSETQHICGLHSVPVAAPQSGPLAHVYHWQPTYNGGWPCHCSQAQTAYPPSARRYSTPNQITPINTAFHQHSLSNSVRTMNYSDGSAQSPGGHGRGSQSQRGPPQKPVQTRHALWVGSIPPGTRILDLRDFFLQTDTVDSIISIVHIPSSHSGFVNFITQASCQNAVHRFNGAGFRGSILNCRLRRPTVDTDLPTTAGAHSRSDSRRVDYTPPETSFTPSSSERQDAPGSPDSEPCIVNGSSSNTTLDSNSADSTAASSTTDEPDVPRDTRYFVLKSLTLNDLEASVRSRQWSTQMHNEHGLNEAFQNSKDVFVIFSANKSREFFGYAKMTSPITRNPPRADNDASAAKFESKYSTPPSPVPGTVTVIPTERINHIPAGRIVDELSRGKIFWEIDGAEQLVRSGQIGVDHNPDPGTFTLQWKSTRRLPFRFASHLKNKWNRDQEVKVGRDGTELEPEVGATLCALFDEPNLKSL